MNILSSQQGIVRPGIFPQVRSHVEQGRAFLWRVGEILGLQLEL
jgi:hypothetical protein